ncbi:MAG: PAS domain S-box protein, partial [Deltaproteobacteria bacterium]
MVTAYSDLSAEEIARRVPPYDKLLYLRKPFFPDEIKHFAIALGSKWQQGRELQGIHHNLEARVRERTSQLVKANEQLKLEIEERKRTDEALRTSEEKYRLLVENQTDLVIKLDAEGRFQYVSPSFCDMFDKTEQDLLGDEFLLLVSQHDRKAIAKTMEALYRPPYTCYVEQRVFTRGEWRWVAWGHKALLGADNNAMAIVGVG